MLENKSTYTNNNSDLNTDNVRANKNGETAETAAADKDDIAVTDLGKFKNVDALMQAYRNLEAEFTRRSQRLKELEEGSKAHVLPEEGAPSRKLNDGELLEAVLSNAGIKQTVIGEYLKTVAGGKSVSLLAGGEMVAAPNAKPKSVKEAGALAARFLGK